MPFTFGDTFVSVSAFDLLIQSEKPPIHYGPREAHSQMNQVAENVASIIKDGDCLSFSHGSMFDALVPHLIHRQDLGIHSLYFTDAAPRWSRVGRSPTRKNLPFGGNPSAHTRWGRQP